MHFTFRAAGFLPGLGIGAAAALVLVALLVLGWRQRRSVQTVSLPDTTD